MEKQDAVDKGTTSEVERIKTELLRLCPEIATENGKIDFERLRLSLGEAVDVGKERYGVNWPGKAECFQSIQASSLATLRPSVSESVNFETTENLFVEGDSLQILKLLQKPYLGAVKMIYIDPPYNTGSDFLYPDDHSETLRTYLEYTGQVDADGKRFSTNTEVSGRFHSKWLNMMYPRLYLARNLLQADGVIFVSIDDHEVHNLRRICDEVFGEQNFICTFCWEKRYSPPPDTKEVGYVHENILFYRKSDKFSMGLLPLEEAQRARYENRDNDPRGPWKAMDYTCRYTKDERPNLFYSIENPNTGKSVLPKATRVWAFSREVHRTNEQENRIWWGKNGKAKVPALKNFLSEIRQGMMPSTLIGREVGGTTHDAAKELRADIPDLKFNPKPIRLLKYLMTVANVRDEDTVLDFFAGSGTAALAVLALNRDDGGQRKFIMTQLPEPTGRDDLPTIADIAKQRIRQTILRTTERNEESEKSESEQTEDLGFRVFRLDESNFRAWVTDASEDVEQLERQLELHINRLRKGRSTQDVLYEILLKSGFKPTTRVDTLRLGGGTVYSIYSGLLFICLESKLTAEMIEEMANEKPERVICLEQSFAGDDQLKANALQIFKSKNIGSFNTV